MSAHVYLGGGGVLSPPNMLRSLAHSGVKHTLSTPSLRAAAAAAPIPVVSAGHARSLVSTVLLTADNYESKQVVELRAMLRQRGLTTGGRKAELVQRLKQSDMQRAGSTLATGAKAPRRGRAAAKSKPEIEAKVAEEVASMPHTPAEKVHHEVSSFSMDRDGTIRSLSPSQPEQTQKHAEAPGQPAHKAEHAPETFNIVMPSPGVAPEPPQFIPSSKAIFDPFRAYPTTYEEDWTVPHVPRVHAISPNEDTLSHHPTVISNVHDSFTPSRPGILEDALRDVLPTHLHRRAVDGVRGVREATCAVMDDALADLRATTPSSDATLMPTSLGRPSTRRPLNDKERSGVFVLGGIVLTGFALGGLGKPKESSQAPRDVPVPRAHFAHGGGIVGNGERRV